jgi:hypothetical protein
VTDVLDIYDSEVLAIEQVHLALNDRARARQHNYTAFEAEIRQRFADIGFTVDVNWYEFEVDGVKQDGAMPEVTITGRTDRAVFDPDRQVHEAVHNILGLPGQEGWIKTTPESVGRLLGKAGGANGRCH